MLIMKAHRFRLKPSTQQLAQLQSYVGDCRFVWNKLLSMNLHRLENKQRLIWYYEADYWTKLWKSSEEYHFLNEVPAHCLQQKLKDLDRAFRDAFDRKQPGKRLPTFRKRSGHNSIRFPEPKQIRLENRRIKLPKLGWLSFYKSKEIEGSIRNVTVSQSGGNWYISIQVEMEIVDLMHASASAIGVDLGIVKFAAFSDGTYLEGQSPFKKHETKLSKEQRKLSKKKKYSNNWKKQKIKITKLHSRTANIRRDFQHKSSTAICKSHAMIVVEDLKIANMSRSAKGSMEKPGKSVRAKSGLNKSILDQGWGEFCRQLEYKSHWRGGVFLKVPPQNTSITCSFCGFKNALNRQRQDHFSCKDCGYSENADINAAKNILAAGHAVLACGEVALVASVKQEPLRTRERLVA